MSLLSRLLGKATSIPSRGRGQMQHLYWTGADGDHAVRAGDWKLRRCNKDIYLFNISADPSELVNRAAASPDWVTKLNGVLDNWLSLLPFEPPPCKTIDPAVCGIGIGIGIGIGLGLGLANLQDHRPRGRKPERG